MSADRLSGTFMSRASVSVTVVCRRPCNWENNAVADATFASALYIPSMGSTDSAEALVD